jgi:hypothetical protein
MFRETIRAVPNLFEVEHRFDSVTVTEQIVDSAVYRFDSLFRTFRKNTHGILAGSSVNQSRFHDSGNNHRFTCKLTEYMM